MKKQTRTTTQTVTRAQSETENFEFVLSDASGLVESAMTHALEFAAQKLQSNTTKTVLEHLRQGDRAAYGYFYYALARQAAEWLGAWDEDVKAVYLYDHEADSEGPAGGVINLVIWAKRKTVALNSMIEALNRALAHSFGNLIGAPHRAHLLDAQIVDDDNIANRTGYGALISSMHYKPVRVWER